MPVGPKPLIRCPAPLVQAQKRETTISIAADRFLINGEPTYKGRSWHGQTIEGLLLNSRMVQATFDDRNPETTSKWAYPDTKKWDWAELIKFLREGCNQDRAKTPVFIAKVDASCILSQIIGKRGDLAEYRNACRINRRARVRTSKLRWLGQRLKT